MQKYQVNVGPNKVIFHLTNLRTKIISNNIFFLRTTEFVLYFFLYFYLFFLFYFVFSFVSSKFPSFFFLFVPFVCSIYFVQSNVSCLSFIHCLQDFSVRVWLGVSRYSDYSKTPKFVIRLQTSVTMHFCLVH